MADAATNETELVTEIKELWAAMLELLVVIAKAEGNPVLDKIRAALEEKVVEIKARIEELKLKLEAALEEMKDLIEEITDKFPNPEPTKLP